MMPNLKMVLGKLFIPSAIIKTKLRKAFIEFGNSSIYLGPEQEEPIPTTPFRDQLETLRRESQWLLRLLVLMIVVFFVVSIVLLFILRNNTAALAAIFSASGASIGWSMNQMRHVARDKAVIDVFYTLLGQCDSKFLQTITLMVTKHILDKPTKSLFEQQN